MFPEICTEIQDRTSQEQDQAPFSCIKLIYNHSTAIPQNLASQLGSVMKLYASKRSKILKNGCHCLQDTFNLANTHDRRKNLKANTDGRQECLIFVPEKAFLSNLH